MSAEHDIELWHDPQYSRPFCVKCETCGWTAACLTETEAIRCREAHRERQVQRES